MLIKPNFWNFFIAVLSLFLFSCSESPEHYNKRAFAVADTIIKYTDINFFLASACQRTWRSAIFDHKYIHPITDEESYCFDFNDALAKYRKDISFLDSSFKSQKRLIESLYATIKKAPDKSTNILNNIKELLNIYNLSYKMMLDPSGSLNSYTENLNNLYQRYEDLKSKLDIERK